MVRMAESKPNLRPVSSDHGLLDPESRFLFSDCRSGSYLGVLLPSDGVKEFVGVMTLCF